ncbi:maltose operon protein MalM [Shimwellia blattae]|uniref:Maltose operon periplasmic protein n=1 Tax=Shimwellia blattae (strain ATCC 29907 / DSM 4481 / JCM 1650 / NBRC 105725 / CDC 9005-74) TaxID=630626 RepID=I2BDX2_SHIBC|nr:maltose operon protein MalM [Shimwellia blattae]AFJ48726.1 maltose operon periplasmic protein precursor [Shimwellia blattae DSM 4481 = NBRC 105725]GAB83058.1 MalM protein [Shimwellia blattae DSM 4481 = NBRC 105725]VDY66213.1 maltose regulon periplasmic protein [Shimwellia blattae]VEC27361.1 maltose regulon periplasmic protein [Shimwellia blattae]
MKMNKRLIALCLSAGLFATLPGVSLADVNIVPQDISGAPAVPQAALQQLNWTPVLQSRTQTTELASAGQPLDVAGITGPVAAYSVPANIGELTLTLTSEIKNNLAFVPNVLILDQNMTPSAYFPGSYFTYQAPGVMSADRLEGVMKLTPALGQQKIYVLVFTTPQDLRTTTTLLDPAKAYAKGVGNAVPDIPDPVARHATQGTLKLKVSTNSSSSILVGPLFGASSASPVTVGNTAAVVAPAAAAPAPAPVVKSEPMLNDTERYFNQAIKDAVARGDIDKALKLLNEAERLGSTSARTTFISSVKGKG